MGSASEEWNARIERLVEQAVRAHDIRPAYDFLAGLEAAGVPWLRGVQLLMKLTLRCEARHAAHVAYLIEEFLPRRATPSALRFLRESENRMRQRLGLPSRPRPLA